ncbi:MAG: hypothetical protein K6A40_08225 [Solobacterium sp.]|nr:hypothetical protein [Solobacterium sp.]
MKRIICLTAALLLCGCQIKEQRSGYREITEGKTFIDDLAETELKKPARTITSEEDLRQILDWMAFYRISDTVWFDVDEQYAAELLNPYPVFTKAYASADLADVYAAHLDDTYYSDFRIVGISHSMSKEIASAAPANIPDIPVVPSFDYRTDGDYICEEDPGKEAVSCENGEQLYYLVMNGYRPLPAKNSMAETLYAAAKDVLHKVIRRDMNDFQKIKAVYDWLTTEVRYDRDTAYSSDTYLVREQAYYLEGVFLNHCAVCDGKSKAYALLLNMLGIPCFRTTGVSEAGDHAWNMVELDGSWYISCTTYGQKNAEKTLGRIIPDYSILLADKDTAYGSEWGYQPQKHRETAAKLESSPYDVYQAMSDIDGISLKIRNLDDLKKLIAFCEDCCEGEYKAEFICDSSDPAAFEAEMIRYLEGLNQFQLIPVTYKGGNAYALLCIKE